MHALDIGIEWPCLMVILMSVERICAATTPVIYKKYFFGYTKMYLVIFVFLAGLVSSFFFFCIFLKAFFFVCFSYDHSIKPLQ